MDYVIAVFRARSETINYANLLKSYGVGASVINTPRQVNVSCGISVRFPSDKLVQANDVISRRKFETFVGFFEIKKMGNNFVVRPI